VNDALVLVEIMQTLANSDNYLVACLPFKSLNSSEEIKDENIVL